MRPGPKTCQYCPYFNTACFPLAGGRLSDPAGIDLSELAR